MSRYFSVLDSSTPKEFRGWQFSVFFYFVNVSRQPGVRMLGDYRGTVLVTKLGESESKDAS